MSDSSPDDDRDESPDDPPANESDHWLSSLLSALDALENGSISRSGRERSDRTSFEYDLSIRTGGFSAGDSPFGDERRARDAGGSRPRRVRSSGPSSDHHVATRMHAGELLVTADVAGVEPADVTVGFDDSMLVIGVEGRELDRIEVPWQEPDSQATIKNGILTVEIRPETEDTGESEADE